MVYFHHFFMTSHVASLPSIPFARIDSELSNKTKQKLLVICHLN
jgi:hypothetical protein